MHSTEKAKDRCLLLCPLLRVRNDGTLRSDDAQREEAIGLCEAISLDVVQQVDIRLQQATASTFMGSGKVAELKGAIEAQDISLVVINAALSPIQQRNLERAWACKVIDRTALILEIFGERARTREGRLQVELAQLHYQKSRLVRAWSHLERQRGGGGFTGGPGETQKELDKRGIRTRISALEKQLEKVSRTRELHRKTRRETPYPVVALVGYTNAGKSTLFNRLTGAEVMAKDLLFATLDPTLREVILPSGIKIILSDTVGFVSDLPTMLVAAFRATLEEVLEADIIVHVRDIAHPDTALQRRDVLHVLQELNVPEEKLALMLEACNKMDLLSDSAKDVVQEQAALHAEQIPLSAYSGEGLPALLAAIETQLSSHYITKTVYVPHGDGKRLAWLHAHADILDESVEKEETVLTVRFSPEAAGRFERLKAS